jgi:hypothetical protein
MEASSPTEDPLQQRADHTGSSHPARFWWWSLLLLLIYLLSPGPTTWLAIKVPSTQRTYTAVYEPIRIACYYCHPVAAFYQWYVFTLWRADWGAAPTTGR